MAINGFFFAYVLMHIIKNKLKELPGILAKIKDILDKLKNKEEESEIWTVKNEDEDDKKKNNKQKKDENNEDEEGSKLPDAEYD